MTVMDAQVRRLMEEITKHGEIGRAAMRADMDRKTARKYVQCGRLPSDMRQPRRYRTRPDPFEADWPWVEEHLKRAPGLEAKILFEALQRREPGKYQDGQLRTLQRRMKQWRAEHGPEREVFFAQEHRPGEAMQIDFTDANELGITIAGIAFAHLLCHVVFPYSNWQAVTVCLSESFLALKRGIQETVFAIGHVPEWAQTDNSTAATHDLRTGKRGFNDDYRELIEHLGMKPRTTAVGAKEQNGDVEASNGALKRRLEQELLLRGSRDFDAAEDYETWLDEVLRRRNRGRKERFDQEVTAMRKVAASRLVEFSEQRVRVTSWSTIRVKYCTYSVPSRLIGEHVVVRLYEDHIEVFCGGQVQFRVERFKGRHRHRINYRHVIWSLVRKPGAFDRYRYREDLFPTPVFRRSYDAIYAERPDIEGDLKYLRLLHLAAATTESEVETVLEALLDQGRVPNADLVKEATGQDEISVPDIAPFEPELDSFDALLTEAAQ